METIVRHRKSGRPFSTGRIVALASVVVLLGGAAVVYLTRTGSTCKGDVTLTIAAAPDHAEVLARLANEWNGGDPVVEGKCAAAQVNGVAPGLVAAALSPAWDEKRNGPRPDVWAPDSSSWMMVLASRPDAAALLPTGTLPSLASSPVVLAMQRPMAEALGWPNKDIDWIELMGAFLGGQTWERFGHPEWGPLRVGMVDPTSSAAGLAGVLGVLDPDNDNTMSSQELYGAVAFSQLVSAFAPDAETLFSGYRENKQPAQPLPAMFPVFERDLAAFAATKPAVSLVPVYPKQGAVYADYPYAVLRAPWVDEAKASVAAAFLEYLRSDKGKTAYWEAGFRDATRSMGSSALLAADKGFKPGTAGSERKPTAESVSQLLGMWTVLQRENNVLVVLDTSGSMKDLVPGTNTTRLQMLQRAAIQGISLLNNQSIIGLWEFSVKLTPTTDYRELVPVGLAGEQLGPFTRRQAMSFAISKLTANGGTGLYDSALAAYQTMQKAWRPNAQNVLVFITDGKNEDPEGITLEQLTTQLKAIVRADRPLFVIGIAVGPQADAAALDTITKVTGGSTFVARDDVSAIQQIVLAFAGRPS